MLSKEIWKEEDSVGCYRYRKRRERVIASTIIATPWGGMKLMTTAINQKNCSSQVSLKGK